MKLKFLYGLCLLGMLITSSHIVAQELGLQEIITGEKDLTAEKNNLKFQSFFFEALKERAINNFSKAIVNLEQCNQIEPNNLAVEFEFSKNYLALKNFFEAEIFIDKALEKEPNNVYLLSHKVLIYKSQYNFSAAIKVQKKLISIHPKYSEDLLLLYLQNKEYENAEKLMVEIEKNALGSPRIVGYKIFLERKLSPVDSLEVITTAPVESTNLSNLKKEFDSNKNYKVLVQILNYELENSLYDLLFTDSENGLELFPTQPFLFYINGLALNKQTKYNEAIAVLTIGIDFVIENNALEANFYEQLAISYEGLNNKSEALKYQQKATQLRLTN